MFGHRIQVTHIALTIPLICFMFLHLGPSTSLLISIRRFISLKYPERLSNTSEVFNMINTISFVLVAIYHLSFMLISTFWDLGQINFIQQCLGEPEPTSNVSTFQKWTCYSKSARIKSSDFRADSCTSFTKLDFEETRTKTLSFQALMLGVTIVPILILQAATILLNLINTRLVNKMTAQVNPSVSNQNRARDHIAKRAIYINLLFLMSYIVYSGIIGKGFDWDLETKVMVVTIPCNISIAIQNPIITRLAFRVNQRIQRNTIEDRRQAEINEALRKREERQRSNQMRNSSTTRVNPEIPTVSRRVQKLEESMTKVEV